MIKAEEVLLNGEIQSGIESNVSTN